MEHILKIHPEYFEAILNNKKTFEIRLNDRDFKVGDTLVLKEYVFNKGFTGLSINKTITYITDYAQKENYVVMSIK